MAKTHRGALPVPKEVALQRRRRAWELRQQLWTQAEIAAELGVSQQQVSRILKRLSDRVAAELAADVARVRAQQTLQLEHVASVAMRGYEASQEPTITVKRTESPDGLKVEQTTRGRDGTPDFLAKAMQAMGDVRKILGAEASPGEPPPPSTADPEAAGVAIAAYLKAVEGKSPPSSTFDPDDATTAETRFLANNP